MNFVKNAKVSDLIQMVRGDGFSNEAFRELVERYTPLLKKRVVTYFGASADDSEPMQEANIALHNAAMTYDSDKCGGVTFGLYASVCISNRLKSLLKKKRRDIDKSELFSEPEELSSADDVESSVVTADICDRVMKEAKTLLSDFEFEVFRLGFESYTTKDIAKSLGRSAKSVDNAKFRISQRLRQNKTICDILSDV